MPTIFRSPGYRYSSVVVDDADNCQVIRWVAECWCPFMPIVIVFLIPAVPLQYNLRLLSIFHIYLQKELYLFSGSMRGKHLSRHKKITGQFTVNFFVLRLNSPLSKILRL